MLDDAVFWSMMEALGTIATAIIALMLAGSRWILDYLNRPKLSLDVVEDVVLPIGPESELFRNLDILIKNNGRLTAKNVNVKVIKVEFPSNNEIIENLEPSVLKSTSLQWEDYCSFGLIGLGIPLGDMMIINPITKWEIERKDCIITLLITGDNFKGFHKVFKYYDSDDIYQAKLLKS